MKKLSLLLVCCMLLLSACSGESSSQKTASPKEDVIEQSTKPEAEPKKTEEQLLLDDDCVKVSFIEVFEEPSIEGVFYFRLQVENKTEKAVTIYLLDPVVNNVSTLALSGIPMTIQPGGKSLTPFFFSYGNLDISSLEELKEVSFKVQVDNNETFENIEVSDVISVSF